ncbi:hypothetical protein Tco_0090153, partial [Tanacetum coccineum]
QALKASKKISRSQPHAGGSSEGTGVSPGVPDKSTIILTTSSEGTGTKPGVPDEETYDDFVHGDEYVHDDVDEEMKDAEGTETGKDDEEINDAKKTKEVKDDNKKGELPPTSSSLSISVEVPLIQSPTMLNVPVSVIPEQSVPIVPPATTLSPPPSVTNLTPILFQVPPAVKEYFGSSLGDALQKKSKSYEKHQAHRALYDALMLSMILDEDDLDKMFRDQPKQKKRDHGDDKDKDPSAGPNQEVLKLLYTEEVIMDVANDNVVIDVNQPQDDSKPKTDKDPKNDWFKQPPRPPTLDREWNKGKAVDDSQEHTWFNDMLSAEKGSSHIDKLTKAHLAGPVYNLLKGTCQSSIELKYNMEECYKALSDKLD